MNTIGWLALLVTIFVTLVLPFLVAILLRRRRHVPLAMFFWGGLFYLINLVLQFPALLGVGAAGIKNGTLAGAIMTSIIYGTFEEVIRYLSFRTGKSMRTRRDEDGALMAGLGHGGTEAIVLGFLPTLNVIYALVAPEAFNQSAKALGTTTTASQFLANAGAALAIIALGRVLAVLGHLGFSTLSVMAYRISWLFFPLVILVHILFDATTFSVQVLTGSELWTMLLFGLWAALSLAFIIYVRRRGIIKPVARVEAVPAEV